ncbi:hypothetical protein X801_02708 [Opisthorchis viverrini]|uniref:Uncharacterized protein n=1 Tax=Opisthorchis viverrini TaxID=6198 RepID=A0A1S8X3V2_OPIVI|nr:hypothetical protein X801_02708 [Opisthorchis viverrini]
MNSGGPAQATLDGSAAEFVPSEELQQQINKRAAFLQVSKMIEPVFLEKGKNFHSQLSQIRGLLSSTTVNAPYLVGEVIGSLTTSSPEHAPVGFRFFKELRSVISDHAGHELEAGLFKSVHETTRAMLTNNAFQQMITKCATVTSAPAVSSVCDEAGDLPKQTDDITITNRAFGLTTFLNLLITRLNLPESPEACVCTPPILPCVDLCQLVELACHVQAGHPRAPSADEPVISELDIFNLRNWTGLFHQLCDSFYQSMMFFNCALMELNSRISDGTWNHSGSLGDQHSKPGQVENGFEHGAQLSCLLTELLLRMRSLLLDEQIPLKVTRSTILDILLCANQLTALSFTNWPEASSVELGFSESEGDEVYESYQRFLEETKQITPS